MGVEFEHEVKKSARGSIETRVEIRTSDVVGDMSIGEVGESG